MLRLLPRVLPRRSVLRLLPPVVTVVRLRLPVVTVVRRLLDKAATRSGPPLPGEGSVVLRPVLLRVVAVTVVLLPVVASTARRPPVEWAAANTERLRVRRPVLLRRVEWAATAVRRRKAATADSLRSRTSASR